MTVASYDHMTNVMNNSSSNLTLLSTSTLRRMYFSHYIKFLFVPSSLHSFPLDFSTTSRGYRSTGRSRDALNRGNALILKMQKKDQNSKQTLIGLPSEWSMMDLKCLPICKDLFCDPICRCLSSTVNYIENISIVKNPLHTFGRCRSL